MRLLTPLLLLFLVYPVLSSCNARDAFSSHATSSSVINPETKCKTVCTDELGDLSQLTVEVVCNDQIVETDPQIYNASNAPSACDKLIADANNITTEG